ncbi:MAG: stage III sporulation protein AE [Candidatus Borkfalkiaceae bacterium]|nr:stage III sporulation protein AE [Christensenellaceae bacterium]
MKKRIAAVLFVLFLPAFLLGNATINDEKTLDEIVAGELENIDLEALEELYELTFTDEKSFSETLNDLLKGKFGEDNESFFGYVKNVIFNNLNSYLPIFAGIVAIVILCSVMQDFKSSGLSEGIGEVISLVGFSAVLILLVPTLTDFFTKTENTIEFIAKTGEIMSPIMATLMVAAGENVSAALYKPSLLFLTNGIIGVYLKIILPLSGLIAVFSVIAAISPRFRFTKFTEFFGSTVKWIAGLIFTVFGVFMTVRGITASSYDGVSFKTAKYLVSNSVPIAGGFLRDGFDLFMAGSVLIKNAVGVAGLFMIFYRVISPVVEMAVFSLLLKATAAVTESFSFSSVSTLLTSLSKSISYFIMCLLTVGFMFFVVILLIILSAGAF